ncbi:MAG: lysophospholipid acyltransferase family protein [Terriglobales bacterium]
MPSAAAVEPESKTAPETFTFRQRLALFLITWVGYLLIRLIGPTLRYTVSIEDGGPPDFYPHPSVFVFWHNAVIPSCWWYRRRDIAVMTSSSFDGEYIARIIEKFGFRAVRGSSTRGAVRALLGMHTEIEAGHSVAFTIDGPRGPVYVAKPGPVLLARNVQRPIQPFYTAVERAWILNSWDRFRFPKPFSRAHLRVAKPIVVPPETDSASAQRLHAEMQAALDRVRDYAESHFKM